MLNCVSKFMERHVHVSFYKFLTDNDLLAFSQSGFRVNHLCQSCLTALLNECVCDLNNGKKLALLQ